MSKKLNKQIQELLEKQAEIQKQVEALQAEQNKPKTKVKKVKVPKVKKEKKTKPRGPTKHQKIGDMMNNIMKLTEKSEKQFVEDKKKPQPDYYPKLVVPKKKTMKLFVTVDAKVQTTYQRSRYAPYEHEAVNQPLQFSLQIKQNASKEFIEESINNYVESLVDEQMNEYSFTTLVGIEKTTIVKDTDLQLNNYYNSKHKKMKAENPIKFEWLKSSLNLQDTGECVYDSLEAIENAPKAFKNREKLLSIFQRFENEDFTDFGLPEVLTLKSGVTPDWINRLCMEYDITHYCLDIEKTVHYKHVSKNNNYSPICYVTHSGHMYLIQDKTFIDKLSQSRSTSGYTSMMLRGNEHKEVGIKTMYENIPIDQLNKYSDCSIIYPTDDLKPMLLQFYNQNSTIYTNKSVNNKITTITIEAKNITLHADPNTHIIHEGKQCVTWQKVQDMCKKYNIPFTNQSFSSLVMTIADQKLKPVRLNPSQQDKQLILTRQDNKCALCKISLKKMEYDHIKPLASGGDNSTDNLQALCVECHFAKSRDEQDNGEYFKLDKATSSFNSICKNIVTSKEFMR